MNKKEKILIGAAVVAVVGVGVGVVLYKTVFSELAKHRAIEKAFDTLSMNGNTALVTNRNIDWTKKIATATVLPFEMDLKKGDYVYSSPVPDAIMPIADQSVVLKDPSSVEFPSVASGDGVFVVHLMPSTKANSTRINFFYSSPATDTSHVWPVMADGHFKLLKPLTFTWSFK